MSGKRTEESRGEKKKLAKHRKQTESVLPKTNCRDRATRSDNAAACQGVKLEKKKAPGCGTFADQKINLVFT